MAKGHSCNYVVGKLQVKELENSKKHKKCFISQGPHVSPDRVKMRDTKQQHSKKAGEEIARKETTVQMQNDAA